MFFIQQMLLKQTQEVPWSDYNFRWNLPQAIEKTATSFAINQRYNLSNTFGNDSRQIYVFFEDSPRLQRLLHYT